MYMQIKTHKVNVIPIVDALLMINIQNINKRKWGGGKEGKHYIAKSFILF